MLQSIFLLFLQNYSSLGAIRWYDISGLEINHTRHSKFFNLLILAKKILKMLKTSTGFKKHFSFQMRMEKLYLFEITCNLFYLNSQPFSVLSSKTAHVCPMKHKRYLKTASEPAALHARRLNRQFLM